MPLPHKIVTVKPEKEIDIYLRKLSLPIKGEFAPRGYSHSKI